MEKNPWREHLPVAAQTPNLPRLSCAARRPTTELPWWRQPQPRRQSLGIPTVSLHPPHSAGRLKGRRLNSSVRTIIPKKSILIPILFTARYGTPSSPKGGRAPQRCGLRRIIRMAWTKESRWGSSPAFNGNPANTRRGHPPHNSKGLSTEGGAFALSSRVTEPKLARHVRKAQDSLVFPLRAVQLFHQACIGYTPGLSWSSPPSS